MRIAFIGCVRFSSEALTKILTLPVAKVVGIVTRASSAFNADFVPLEPLATANGIPCFLAQGNDQSELAQWLRALSPDVIYCFGWSNLLSEEVLAIPALGVVGYHPAALPKNRGRHPIIWALVLGLTETASTFFFMDGGADSGELLSQRPMAIMPSDDSGSLYAKLTIVALEQIEEFTPQLASGTYRRLPQDHCQANYWRKRSRKDGCIDWRMTAEAIHNLVRALAPPYPGAHCEFAEKEIKVWKTEIDRANQAPPNLEPGKVLEVSGETITVKCGEGVLRLLAHEFPNLPEPGTYL